MNCDLRERDGVMVTEGHVTKGQKVQDFIFSVFLFQCTAILFGYF